MSDRVPSVVLLSGGLDSAANLAFCVKKDQAVLALTCRYGQRAADREARAAARLCETYNVRHEVIDLPWLGKLGGSSLTDSTAAMPEFKSSELDDAGLTRKSARSVWVPNRNGVLINIAAAFAERMGASRVVVGFNREEAATFPDNSIAYLERATTALSFSTANHVKVFSYTASWDKREIVRELELLDSKFPFDGLWSCYQGGTSPCGICESCQRLSRALEARR